VGNKYMDKVGSPSNWAETLGLPSALLDLILTNKEGLVGNCEGQGQHWLQ